MDDGVAIIALDASSCDTQSTLSTILSTLDTHLYTAPSHATFDLSIDHFNMLECTITYHNSQLTVTHWSKNFTHAYLTHAQRYLKGTPAHSHGYRPLTHITNNFTRILTNTLHTPSHHIHIAASILKMAYESHVCLEVPKTIITEALSNIATNHLQLTTAHRHLYNITSNWVHYLHPTQWATIIFLLLFPK